MLKRLDHPVWQESPKISKNGFRKSLGASQLNFLLQRVADRVQAMEFRATDPTFQKRRKHRADYWIVGPVQETGRIFAEPFERREVGDMGQRRKIAIKVGVPITHFQKSLKMVAVPRQGPCSAVSGNHRHPAFQWQPETGGRFEVVADAADAKLATGMGQERKIQRGEAFPERFKAILVTVDVLDARQ